MKTRLFLLSLLFSGKAFTQTEPLVYQEPGTEKITAQRQIYRTVNDTTLHFDLYLPVGRPAGEKVPLVVFVNGVGALDMPEWRVYQDWARLVANRGLAAVTFQSRSDGREGPEPDRSAQADTEALLDFLRRHAAEWQLDADRIGIYCCSANAKTAMPVVMQADRSYLQALVIFYGYIGKITLTRLDLPMLLARAGQDWPPLNEGMARFFAQALQLDAPAEFINYPSGLHGFDTSNDTDESRAIIRRTLDFLVENLRKPAAGVVPVPTPGNLHEIVLVQQRTEAALAMFQQSLDQHRAFLATHPGTSPASSPFYGVVSEDLLNQTGRQLLEAGRVDEAIHVFQTNQAAWPASPNTAEALAEAYEAKGNRAEAIRYAELALRQLDATPGLGSQRAAAIRKSAMDRLGRLKKD